METLRVLEGWGLKTGTLLGNLYGHFLSRGIHTGTLVFVCSCYFFVFRLVCILFLILFNLTRTGCVRSVFLSLCLSCLFAFFAFFCACCLACLPYWLACLLGGLFACLHSWFRACSRCCFTLSFFLARLGVDVLFVVDRLTGIMCSLSV